jgi:transposase InsO family protein
MHTISVCAGSADLAHDATAMPEGREATLTSLKQARVEIARWRIDYNEVRPHSSCGRMPPAKFAAQHRRTTSGAVPAPQQTQE